jgi:PRTRC genetic system ThiF family protein
MEFSVPAWIHSNSAITIHVIGAGGTGSNLLQAIASLHKALTGMGHKGLNITIHDPGVVNETNVARQNFYISDIGIHKAMVLAHRVSMSGVPCAYQLAPVTGINQLMGNYMSRRMIVITCTDTKSSRRDIHNALTEINRPDDIMWLDIGNTASTAQVVLGQPMKANHRRKNAHGEYYLPCVTRLFPHILDTSIPEDNAPSCSMAESIASQGLFVNRLAADYAGELLWKLFSKQKLKAHGGFLNIEYGTFNPLPVCEKTWARFEKNHKCHAVS